jgi:hypothetical protein
MQHILETWIAVESDYTNIADNVQNVSEQLRRIVDSHLNSPFVRNIKTRMKVRGAH